MKTFYLKIKNLVMFFLKQEIIRFLMAGGINTIVGGILIPYVVLQIVTFNSEMARSFLPLIIGYIVWFPFAYLIQVYFVFRTQFDIKRFLLYPTTQIPNYLINQGLLYVFNDLLKLNELVSLILAALIAAPIMFVLVRFVVKKGQKELL